MRVRRVRLMRVAFPVHVLVLMFVRAAAAVRVMPLRVAATGRSDLSPLEGQALFANKTDRMIVPAGAQYHFVAHDAFSTAPIPAGAYLYRLDSEKSIVSIVAIESRGGHDFFVAVKRPYGLYLL